MKNLVSDLNHMYTAQPALHRFDFEPQGFEWIECNDSDQSVLSYLRRSETELIIVLLNFTPVPRQGYRLGVPQAGRYEEILNSDSSYYNGSNVGNQQFIHSEEKSWMGRPHSLSLTLPPLAGLILKYVAK